jgi:hypothetical protein
VAGGAAPGTDPPGYPGQEYREKVRIEDKHGQMHDIEVTVYGRKVLLLIDAVTKIHLAVKVGADSGA